jgi:hypothetical protein
LQYAAAYALRIRLQLCQLKWQNANLPLPMWKSIEETTNRETAKQTQNKNKQKTKPTPTKKSPSLGVV